MGAEGREEGEEEERMGGGRELEGTGWLRWGKDTDGGGQEKR